jgi:hypothetical protein
MARSPRSDAIRHTFLVRFGRSLDGAALRRVGNLIGMLTYECPSLLPAPQRPDVAVLRAASWDLRHLELDLLTYRGREPYVEPWRSLYLLAGRVAHEAVQLADQIDAALREVAR